MNFDIIIGIFAINEKTTPNYVVPTSNFSSPDEAYLIGIPCKVLSDRPYKKSVKTILDDVKVESVIDVQSMATGLKYTIPADWVEKYDSLVQANDNADIIGHHFPDVKELIGKPYWPRDNSYIVDSDRKWADLYKKKCEIISVPFKETISTITGEKEEYSFILVKYEGRVYRVLFEEWALIEP